MTTATVKKTTKIKAAKAPARAHKTRTVKSTAHPEQGMDLLRMVLAIVFPPLGVYMQVGASGQFWLNIVLTILGYVPGIIHAIWIISTRSTVNNRMVMSH